jgi:uncharacterized protein (DUF2267 family)
VARIEVDFSKLPSEVALFLSQQEHTRALADALARIMRLGDDERQMLRDELIGAVAEVVDGHLP